MSRSNTGTSTVSRRQFLAGSASAAAALLAGNDKRLLGLGTAHAGSGPAVVRLTWLSVANFMIDVGGIRILIDGYITRGPQQADFFGGGGGLAFTTHAFTPDEPAIRRVKEVLGDKNIDWVMTSHSHFDHSFDTAVWAKLTGAPVIGSQTTAYQAIAQGVPASQCHVVLGGEVLDLGGGITCRVIRTNHSGSHTANPEQHDPVELTATPTLDPTNGGLRPGVAEDFPNGGGGRAYLFTVGNRNQQVTFFYTSSLSAVDLDVPIVVDGVDYGAPSANIAAGMADAGLDSVDLWLGAGGTAVAALVLPVVKPKVYIPNHFGSFFTPFGAGLTTPFSNPDLVAMVEAQGGTVVPVRQYMDLFRLDRSGVQPLRTPDIKHKLGLPEVPDFSSMSPALLAAADVHCCCG